MATSVSSVVSHFPSAENGFTTTTSGSVPSGATTVGLNSVAGYTNGEIAVFVIDPTDATKKQTFTGTIDTAGVQVTDVVWTAGTNQTHALGATVVDYATATHISMVSKGILVEHAQSGVHSAALITSRTEDTSPDLDSDFLLSYDTSAAALKKVKPSSLFSAGWSDTEDVPDTVTYNGNRSYDLVFNSNDLTDTVSNGMRVKLTRTVTPPTQCTDLESGSSQYWSKTSPAGTTFTDDFCVGAWIKLESYTTGTIIARFNGTSGWQFIVQSDGTLLLGGYNAGSTNYSRVTSYQSIPLNKWVHVSAQLDMSAFTATTTTSYIMIDGVNVPAYVERGGTNPTALVQAGDLTVGARSGGSVFFDGELAQVWYSNAKITQSTVQTFISQGMTGSETSIVSHFDFNGDANDNNANANNLTANGGATATTVDSPFNATEYGIITANSFSTNTTLTVQVPEGYAIPTSGGVSAVAYSTQDVPYGFPRDKGKWRVEMLNKASPSQGSPVTNTWYNLGSQQVTIPVGAWCLGYMANLSINRATAGALAGQITLSTTSSSSSNTFLQAEISASAANTDAGIDVSRFVPISITSSTPYYLNTRSTVSVSNIYNLSGDRGPTVVYADLAYI